MFRNVHGNTVDHLAHAIISGRYPPGASIPPEPLLGEELGVSRTVVREVLESLIAKGLVSSGPKVGTRVLSPDLWNWFDPEIIAWPARAGAHEPDRAEQATRVLIDGAHADIEMVPATRRC